MTDINSAIVVGENAHVFVCEKYEESPDGRWVNMINARIIRTWGTSKGLNELIDGPTKSTILDHPAPVISLAYHACLAIIPVNQSQWAKTFSRS
jgi:hypothetical protein